MVYEKYNHFHPVYLNIFMKKRIVLLISIVVPVFIVLLIIGTNQYLSETEKIKAELLVVEGWLSDDALDLVLNEFQTEEYSKIITTGLRLPEYQIISQNGYLIFNINKIKSCNDVI